MATETDIKSLQETVAQKQDAVTTQGDIVRALKADKAEKAAVEAAIAELKRLKIDLELASKELNLKAAGTKGSSLTREAFRLSVNSALERRMFIIPSFKIYGGVAGFYDYGPPGCAVKSNVLQFWRQHFVLEENMLEIDCPCVTPDAVLRASGHVEKFTDLMVKDEATGNCFRADHLLKDHVSALLEREGSSMSADRQRELQHLLATVDELRAGELGERIRELGITAPDTKNQLSEPYPFNLMFSTMVGPTGLLQGYLRPETAQGIFVNFKDLLYYNGGKLPFAAAQIGQAFRNEIAPRAGLLRVREFTLAEIEHFVPPGSKAHPKFHSLRHLTFLLYPREQQLGEHKKAVAMRLGDAVEQGIVNNETLGYFLGRTYQFLTALGIQPDRLRFRQHLAHEMAHYAADCWDAEIECSYGWVECVGLADRAAFDLRAHSDKSKVELVAYEKYEQARDEEVLKVSLNRKEMGKVFKKDQKIICESLEAMSEADAMALQSVLTSQGSARYTVCNSPLTVTLTKDMVSVSKETKKVSGRNFTPGVIEPSFGIGRIIYCLYEHSFYLREGEDEQRSVFRFTPLVAPIKCTVFPLVSDSRLDAVAQAVSQALTKAGVANKIDTTGNSIGKRYARTDEIGVPYAITVDFQTIEGDGSLTLRERDSMAQIRIMKSQVHLVVRELSDGLLTWSEAQAKYPTENSKSEHE